VHGERQNVHRFLAAINFHVRACGLVVHTSGGFLRHPVIQNTPKTSDVARFFNPVQIQVVSTVSTESTLVQSAWAGPLVSSPKNTNMKEPSPRTDELKGNLKFLVSMFMTRL
jgi:hypothetical protein